MKKTICFILFIFMVMFGAIPMDFAFQARAVSPGAEPEISSKSAYLVDYQTGTVIFEKNAEERLQIA